METVCVAAADIRKILVAYTMKAELLEMRIMSANTTTILAWPCHPEVVHTLNGIR